MADLPMKCTQPVGNGTTWTLDESGQVLLSQRIGKTTWRVDEIGHVWCVEDGCQPRLILDDMGGGIELYHDVDNVAATFDINELEQAIKLYRRWQRCAGKAT